MRRVSCWPDRDRRGGTRPDRVRIRGPWSRQNHVSICALQSLPLRTSANPERLERMICLGFGWPLWDVDGSTTRQSQPPVYTCPRLIQIHFFRPCSHSPLQANLSHSPPLTTYFTSSVPGTSNPATLLQFPQLQTLRLRPPSPPSPPSPPLPSLPPHRLKCRQYPAPPLHPQAQPPPPLSPWPI